MKCLFLYNPQSGKGKIAKKAPMIERTLLKKYDEVETVATKSAEDLRDRVKHAACDVVFAGGDGTFHTVLQAAQGGRFGYLPSGTVNDVARSLGIPRDLKRALKVVLKGKPVRIDCMKTGGCYSAYVAAAGAFTQSTYETPQARKKALGPLAYALYGLRHGFPLRVFPLKIVCDGAETQTDAVLVLVLNGRSVAGFPVNKEASMRDGKLEVAVIKQAKKPAFLRRAAAVFSLGAVFLCGVRVKRKDVLFLQGSKIKIETEEDLVWDLDGEKGPLGNIGIELVKNHMKIFI